MHSDLLIWYLGVQGSPGNPGLRGPRGMYEMIDNTCMLDIKNCLQSDSR